uniref:Transmembrane protein 119b n=1 Tax=Cyprinodon variegatus TaxID=28743 RepID=A0A3Q2EI75_CYPVA
MHPEALYPISLCLVFCLSRSLATHLPLYSPLEGSTDEEELSYINSSVFTGVHPTEYQTTPPEPSQEQRTLPTEFATFLEENMLLILVSTILIFLTFLITCGAFFMSRRLKVNSYHPCSFPSKMYVDHQDKTGGTKIFCEVQGKVVPELELEAVDSNKQLQEEILRAASSLRTPKKCAPAAERSEAKVNAADQKGRQYLQFHYVSTSRGPNQSCSNILGVFVQRSHISRVLIMIHHLERTKCIQKV